MFRVLHLMLDRDILDITAECVALLKMHKIRITTAESCTGGLLAGYITSIPGASAVLDRGFVTYSNESKIDLLGVTNSDLEKFGAVSAEVASVMVKGALKNSLSDLAISITGIAGPNNEGKKEVGLVYIGIAFKDLVNVQKNDFNGNRDEIRSFTIIASLKIIKNYLLRKINL